MTGSRGVLLLAAFALLPGRAAATVEMQGQAKKLGFELHNCLYCHASPHSVEVMKKKARDLEMADGNCLACHGARIPAALNQRGRWLVQEKGRRHAKECDMAWLKDYKEAPASKPAHAKPAAKPGLIQVAPNP